jgi:uncharacterized YccA/Bax inhibitor family protein
LYRWKDDPDGRADGLLPLNAEEASDPLGLFRKILCAQAGVNASRGAAVLRGVLAAQQPGANAIPMFFGETVPSTVKPGPALAVSIYSEAALSMIATLHALHDVRRRRQHRAARRKRCAGTIGGQEQTMASAMTMRSGNPALTADTFAKYRAVPGAERMTLGGTVNKTALSLVILLVAASYVWNRGAADPSLGAWIMVSVVAGLVVALVTVFKQTWAPFTTPVYAVLEGVALGGISVVFQARYPGIVSQAVFLTFGTLGALLVAYRSGVIRATENFKLGVVAATGGIALLYLLSFVLGFFGVSVPLIHSSGTFGILFSVFVVVIAALNLVLDFDFIEQGVERGAPKHMEWYGAFGLLVTLVWLYLEILHLLAKLQSRQR